MPSHSYKSTSLTLEQIIIAEKSKIPSINQKAQKALGIGSPSTWITRKKKGNLKVSEILNLAQFLGIHPAKIFNACLNSQKYQK